MRLIHDPNDYPRTWPYGLRVFIAQSNNVALGMIAGFVTSAVVLAVFWWTGNL